MAPWYSTIEGLQEHLTNGAVEDYETEFKAAASFPPKNPETPKEFRKDVSALANASGGVLIVGVGQNPEGFFLDPIPVVNRDAEERRLQQYLDQLDPRLTDVTFRWLSVDPTGSVLVVEVGKSLHGPHQNDDHVFYIRDGGRVTQMKQKQLAHEFTGGAKRAAAMRELRQERMEMAESGQGLPAIAGPHLMIRLHGLDEQAVHVSAGTCQHLRPIWGRTADFLTNVDGLIIRSGGDGDYVAALRTGCVEWHCGLDVIPRFSDGPERPFVALAEHMEAFCKNAAPGAVQWLRAVGLRGPLLMTADISGVQGLAIYSKGLRHIDDYDYLKLRFDRRRIMIPEILFDDRDLGLTNALADLCAEIWRAAGHEASPHELAHAALVGRLAKKASG